MGADGNGYSVALTCSTMQLVVYGARNSDYRDRWTLFFFFFPLSSRKD